MSNLKNIRKSMNLTQKQLAELIGQSAASVGHYESGRRSPDIETCHQILVALSNSGKKVSFEDIFPHPTGPDHAV